MTTLLWIAAAGCVVAAAASLLLRGRRRTNVLQLADAATFGSAARRTWIAWLALAGGLVALLLVFNLGTRTQPAGAGLLPARANAIIVLDLSGSMKSSSKRIANALLGLTRDGRRNLGLVVFSDAAYEALPPSTPPEGIRDWLSLFLHDSPSVYPWTPSFSKGTLISSGLAVARRMLRRDGIEDGHVVLVSDLVDSPVDLPNLQSVVAQYQREGIDLRVISVPPRTDRASVPRFAQQANAAFVERAATQTIHPAKLPHPHSRTALLVILIAVIGLFAAAYELGLQTLSWRTPS
jgi:hypothetical protein